MKFEHFIFDIDGTVLDTEEPLIKATDFTLRHYGYEFDKNTIRSILGQRIEYGFEKLKVKYDGDYLKIWEREYKKYAHEAKYYDNLENVLEKLKRKNISMGIVTSRSRSEFEEFLQGLRLEYYFDLMIFSDDTKRHKPDAEPLLKYISLKSADKEKCIYIGDMKTDVLCAKNASVKSGFVRWNASNMTEEDADFIFEKPEDMLSIL